MKRKFPQTNPFMPLLLIGAIAFQGCSSLHTVSISHPTIGEGDKVVVELKNGESEKLDLINITENEIEGFDRKGNLQSIDLADVDRLAIRQHDPAKTKALVGAVGLIGAIGAGIVITEGIEQAGAAAVWGAGY